MLDFYNARIARREKEYQIHRKADGFARTTTRSGTGQVRYEGIEMTDTDGEPKRVFRVGDHAQIRLRPVARESIEGVTFGFSIRDRLRNDVFGTNSFHLGYRDLAIQAL